MNINFGLIDSYLDNKKIKEKDRKTLQSKKALLDFENWINKTIYNIATKFLFFNC